MNRRLTIGRLSIKNCYPQLEDGKSNRSFYSKDVTDGLNPLFLGQWYLRGESSKSSPRSNSHFPTCRKGTLDVIVHGVRMISLKQTNTNEQVRVK